MPNHTTHTQQMSNLHEFKDAILKYPTDDRKIMFTNWINMLIRTGVASSVNQAEKMIGSDIGMTPQAIHRYYQGEK